MRLRAAAIRPYLRPRFEDSGADVLSRLAITLTLGAAAWLALVAGVVVPQGYDAARMVAAGDDPARIADLALEKQFDAAAARREIEQALAAGDAELARSFVDLAHERGLAIDPVLRAKVEAAERDAASYSRRIASFARGLVTGEPEDVAGFAGTMLGDLFVFGDVRDTVREGSRLVRGADADKLVLALAGAGLAVTAGTYVSMGLVTPARAGLSVAKVAARTGRIGAKLVHAIKLEKTEGLVRFAGDVGRLQSKAGTRTALDGLRLAQEPKDMTRVARLAEAKGSKTRAILKVAGRGAIVLGTALFDLALWMFWALLNLLGLVVALKRAVERMTLRHLQRRRMRRLRAVAAAAPAG
jgi:hypothetical protein